MMIGIMGTRYKLLTAVELPKKKMLLEFINNTQQWLRDYHIRSKWLNTHSS
jgi:hypothetical protein